jgi:hypothetical protein
VAVLLAEVLRHPESTGAPRPAELDYIRRTSRHEAVKVPWTRCCVIARSGRSSSASSSPIRCGGSILFWLPSYLDASAAESARAAGIGVDLHGSSVGSILGGWLSGTLIKRGWPSARRA